MKEKRKPAKFTIFNCSYCGKESRTKSSRIRYAMWMQKETFCNIKCRDFQRDAWRRFKELK